jgi:GDP-D-mannose dehydratase
MTKALIAGIKWVCWFASGRLLLSKGYQVLEIVHHLKKNTRNINCIRDRLALYESDIRDEVSYIVVVYRKDDN